VRAAIESTKRADDAFAAAKHAADLSHEALTLANQAYRAGATTNLELIDAERFARDADTSAVVAEDAAREARLELLIAAGRFP
jgi:outer membrane protein TolC